MTCSRCVKRYEDLRMFIDSTYIHVRTSARGSRGKMEHDTKRQRNGNTKSREQSIDACIFTKTWTRSCSKTVESQILKRKSKRGEHSAPSRWLIAQSEEHKHVLNMETRRLIAHPRLVRNSRNRKCCKTWTRIHRKTTTRKGYTKG